MSQYYIHNGQRQTGPYTLDQLKTLGITTDTPIWRDGMSSWTKAAEMPELREIFGVTPPPFTHQQFSNQSQAQQPRSKTKWPAYVIALIILVAFGIIYLVNRNSQTAKNFDDNSINSSKTEEEIKDDLGARERLEPTKYFEVVPEKPRTNMLGETVMEGKIVCKAKVAKFKDPVLEAQFYSASNTLLATRKFTSYQVYSDGAEAPFKFKTFAPKETATINYKIVDAVVVY